MNRENRIAPFPGPKLTVIRSFYIRFIGRALNTLQMIIFMVDRPNKRF